MTSEKTKQGQIPQNFWREENVEVWEHDKLTWLRNEKSEHNKKS